MRMRVLHARVAVTITVQRLICGVGQFGHREEGYPRRGGILPSVDDEGRVVSETQTVATAHGEGRSLGGLMRYFLKLGSSGFGGPIALVGYMQRDLVEARGWFTEDEYRQGLALAQTMPGPLAAQLAMWFGFLESGVLGAAAVAVPFVAPACVLVMAVAVLYAKYQGLPVVHEIFLGVGPAVLAIIAIAAYKLARSTNRSDPLLWVIAVIVCAVTAAANKEIFWLILVAGAFGLIYYGGGLPRWPRREQVAGISPVGALARVKGFAWSSSGASLGSMGWFFIKASAFTFGSGLAIVPFLHQGLVQEHHWLTERQFVDAVAMGLISPGPVVIMATFAGYLVAGIAGAFVASVAVFLPVYFFVIIPGRTLRRHAEHPRLAGFIRAATAAAAGAIAGAAVIIGEEVITRPGSVVIALAALALLLQRRVKVPEPAIVAMAASVGIAAFG
jgi:chromate transporter